jgi:hypothetical protein
VLLTALAFAAAGAQSVHVGAGLGPTVVFDGDGDRNVMGFVGVGLPAGVGFRLEGMDTVDLVLLTANLTLTTSAQGRFIRTYLVVGGGGAVDLDVIDPEINAGLGLALPLVPGLNLFGEARLHRLLDSERSRKTLLPITFGVRIG